MQSWDKGQVTWMERHWKNFWEAEKVCNKSVNLTSSTALPNSEGPNCHQLLAEYLVTFIELCLNCWYCLFFCEIWKLHLKSNTDLSSGAIKLMITSCKLFSRLASCQSDCITSCNVPHYTSFHPATLYCAFTGRTILNCPAACGRQWMWIFPWHS